jgi:rhodanese-related sulfurtransferase
MPDRPGATVKLANFARILSVCVVLSAYSSWSLAVRQREHKEADPSNPEPVAGIPLLGLKAAEELWHDRSTLFVDVRSATDYEFGHIAGAVSLPDEEFEQRFGELKPRLERAEAIVVYCKSVDCGKSLWCALRLRDAGLLQTKIYPYGWNQWFNNSLPIAGLGR